jgi:hypothetical protein
MKSSNPVAELQNQLSNFWTGFQETATRVSNARREIEKDLGEYAMDSKVYKNLLSVQENLNALRDLGASRSNDMVMVGNEYSLKEKARLTARGPVMMGQEGDQFTMGGPEALRYEWTQQQESKFQKDLAMVHQTILDNSKILKKDQDKYTHWVESTATKSAAAEFNKLFKKASQKRTVNGLPGFAKFLMDVETPIFQGLANVPVFGGLFNSLLGVVGNGIGVNLNDLYNTGDPKTPLEALIDGVLDLVVAFLEGLGFVGVDKENLKTGIMIAIIASLVIFIILPATKEIKNFLS